jgi:hypothetical protein
LVDDKTGERFRHRHGERSCEGDRAGGAGKKGRGVIDGDPVLGAADELGDGSSEWVKGDVGSEYWMRKGCLANSSLLPATAEAISRITFKSSRDPAVKKMGFTLFSTSSWKQRM